MGDTGLAGERVLVCRSEGERFALPVGQVREVVALPPVSRIPGAGEHVLGLANVHGILVTVLAPPTLAPASGPPAGGLLVVLTLHRGQVGFAVEEAEELAGAGSGAVRVVEVDAVVRGVLGGS
jgi:chemotaxis signal transduction protein